MCDSVISKNQLVAAMNELGVKYNTHTVQSTFIGTEYRIDKLSDVKRVEKKLGVRSLFKGGGKQYPYHVTFYN